MPTARRSRWRATPPSSASSPSGSRRSSAVRARTTCKGPYIVVGMAISTVSAEWTDPGAFPVAEGIHRIPLPMPSDGLKAVNVYAIENGDGLALVDTGWDHPAAVAALTSGLAAIGASIADLNTIIVTHFHADHYALAGPLREESGAPVLFPEEGLPGVRVA